MTKAVSTVDHFRPFADIQIEDKLRWMEPAIMSRDARNSILLWVGTLVFIGLFWACLHFDIGANIPDSLLWPMLGIVVGANILKSIWDFFRKRKSGVS